MTAMTVTRRNIIDSAESGDRFVEGVVLLDQEMSGLTTAELNNILSPQVPGFRIFGINQEVSVWDLFVLWHFLAMRMSSAPPRPLRNLAHGGPVFLPWHRMFLIRLEEELQRVTADAQTALPYWDWAADGELPADEQPQAPLWDLLGETSGDVVTGPLAAMQVRLAGFQMQLWSIDPRPLTRAAGEDELAPSCPPPPRWRGRWGVATTMSRSGRRRGQLPQPGGGMARPRGRPRDTSGPAEPQPGPRLGRRRHGPRHLAQRSRVLSQPLQRGSALGILDGPAGAHLPADGRRPRRPPRPSAQRPDAGPARRPADPCPVLDPTAWYVYDELVDTS
jgi:hypothetical protein